jgi:hypothetical protein
MTMSPKAWSTAVSTAERTTLPQILGASSRGLRGSGKKASHKRRRARREQEEGLFRSFTISTDPSCKKYMPYNRLVYPRVHGRPKLHEQDNLSYEDAEAAGVAEVESMWMVGLVEETERNKKGHLLQELQDFIGLPGSTVLPGSTASLAEMRKLRKNEEGQEVNPSGSVASSSLTELEHLKLGDLERRLDLEKVATRLKGTDNHAKLEAKMLRLKGMRAYLGANRKLTKVLRGARPRGDAPLIASSIVDSIYKISLREHAAAIRLQRFYRGYYYRKCYANMAWQVKQLIKIQAIARGYVTRRLLAEWHAQREGVVLAWQTIMRRTISNARWSRQRENEAREATRIQAAWRGAVGRHEARRERRNKAALTIQSLWRGCVSRARTDRTWLDQQATLIQKLARRLVARRVMRTRRKVVTVAAVAIQRGARGLAARMATSKALWDRETQRRVEHLRLLASEEQWLVEWLQILERRLERSGLKASVAAAGKREVEAHEAVSECMNATSHIVAQTKLLSPRAMEQGWREEMGNDLVKRRETLTQAKLNAIFGAAADAREAEEDLERRESLTSEMRMRVDQIASWRESAQRSMHDRHARRELQEHRRAWRQSVADEKRNWEVEYFTPSGKPDKLKTRRRRCPQEAWADPIERAAHKVFCGGAVDLLAGSTHDPRDANDSRSGLDQVVAKLQLQNHMTQVAVFDSLFKPAEDILVRHSALPQQFVGSRAETHQPDHEEATLEVASPLRAIALAPANGELATSSTILEEVPPLQQQQLAQGGVEEATTVANSGPPRRRPFAGFADCYGAAASVPAGKPLDPGKSPLETPVTPALSHGGGAALVPYGSRHGDSDHSQWRRRQRQRQRALHSIKREEEEGTSQIRGKVSWELLDELEAEKRKLQLAKAWDPLSNRKR